MNLTSPSDVRSLLLQLGIQPNRVLGQNFLIDANILRIVVETAEAGPEDLILEVGPGLGVLTEDLLARGCQVVAIEKDSGLHAYLRETLGAKPRLQLLHADAMDVDYRALLPAGRRCKLVANLPYAIASRLLVDLLEEQPRLERLTVTVQREVADRLTASPDTTDYGVLSLLTQMHATVTKRHVVRRTCFYPPPQVLSAIVDLQRVPAALTGEDYRRFRTLVKHAFSQRRKQLGTILQQGQVAGWDRETMPSALAAAHIEGRRRPETLSLAEWIALTQALRPS